MPVEVWATDEHRIGLMPVRRAVWAPIGQRPEALGHPRFKWLYVTAFVAPASGETVWYLSNGVSKLLFEEMLAGFARDTGAGKTRNIILVLDNAGWHGPKNLKVPRGLQLFFLPPCTPELQPAECIWTLVDEPLVNRWYDDLPELEAAIEQRLNTLTPEQIKPRTNFHWWPK